MAITKNVEITLKQDNAMLDDKLFFYQNDSGINVRFSIKELKYEITRTYSMFSLENSSASMTIVDPDGVVIFNDTLTITNNMIVLAISPRLTSIIGEYTFQIHLHDNSRGKLTLPPCSWEIKPLIGTPSNNIGIVGNGNVGECVTGSETFVYDETNWQTGDVITAGRLNKIETKLDELDYGIDNFDAIVYEEI
ncbi:MAG: hypothetical protein ACRDD7_15735 [Peptostreptococcaceae bacterium]